MRFALLLLIGLLGIGCSPSGPPTSAQKLAPPEEDIVIVDEYLEGWSYLVRMPTAEDAKRMAAELKKRQSAFEEALVRLLDNKDPRAAGRLVYSQVIQVGAFLDADSKLGTAVMQLVGKDVPISVVDGDRLFFAGDFYLWWKKNRETLEPYRPLVDWEDSGIAKETVIPMYLEHAKGRVSP